MRHGRSILFCLGACIALMACPSGPSGSGSSSSGKDAAAAVARKIEHIEGLLARRPVAGRIIEDLISALPDRVRLTEASYDSGKVRVKGIAPSNNLLADYVARLDDSPSLADLTLGGSVMKTTRGRESWEFTLAAVAADAASEVASAGSDPAARLAELERGGPGPPGQRRDAARDPAARARVGPPDDQVRAGPRSRGRIHCRAARRDRGPGWVERRCQLSPRPGRASRPLGGREIFLQGCIGRGPPL